MTIASVKELAHYFTGEDGWVEVADYALGWAIEYAAKQPAA